MSSHAQPAMTVAISGASGVIYGIRLLEMLKDVGIERHLIMTQAAEVTLAYETDFKVKDIHAKADVVYRPDDIAAPISSGSFPSLGMIIAPCSVSTMSEIASGIANTLITRAADVTLKERRKLVLMVRETPLHLGHLRAMTAVTEIGAIVAPPMPAFYSHPQSLDDLINHNVARVLDLFGLDTKSIKRWGQDVGPTPKKNG